MSRAFQFFRKRTTKRRLIGLWLCLVAVELFCPIFCAERVAFGANSRAAETEISSQSLATSNTEVTSIDQYAAQADDHGTSCGDDCLCHAAAIPCIAIDTEPTALRSEHMTIGYANAFSNSLPPPYLPPKFS